MKQLFSFLVIGLLAISVSGFQIGKSVVSESKVKVVFNRQLEFDDLTKIKSDLSQKNIVINYKKLQFDNNGKLMAIDFYVDCKDGFSGSASEDNLTNQSRFGFVRDYSANAKIPFETGNLATLN